MATKNAPFYSIRAGRPESLKSHTLRRAAIRAAGEMGQVFMTVPRKQRQVHKSAAGGWMTVEPDGYFALDMEAELISQGMISPRESSDDTAKS